MRPAPRLIVLFTLVAYLLPIQAATVDWKAGFASVKITPEMPVLMAGYAARIKPSQRVEQDIYAKALVLEDGAGQRAVGGTTDLVGMPRAFVDPLAEAIQARTGLAREQLLFSWSHSHSGPTLTYDPKPPPGVAAV